MKINRLERFMLHVELIPFHSCWEWIGSKTIKGYGMFRWDKYKNVIATRGSYVLHKGEIPKGMLVCHKCDNPSCVNPSHLFLGTAHDNMRDMREKGRDNYVYGEQLGTAKLTENTVKQIRDSYRVIKSARKLGLIYGINKSTVLRIVKRVTWKHVA